MTPSFSTRTRNIGGTGGRATAVRRTAAMYRIYAIFFLSVTTAVSAGRIPAPQNPPTHCLVGNRDAPVVVTASGHHVAGCSSALAWCAAHDAVNTTGWATLYVASNASLTDADQAWAASVRLAFEAT